MLAPPTIVSPPRQIMPVTPFLERLASVQADIPQQPVGKTRYLPSCRPWSDAPECAEKELSGLQKARHRGEHCSCADYVVAFSLGKPQRAGDWRPRFLLRLLGERIVRWVDVLNVERPRAMDLDDRLGGRPGEVRMPCRHFDETAHGEHRRGPAIQPLAMADIKLAGDDGDQLIAGMGVRWHLISAWQLEPQHKRAFRRGVAGQDRDLRARRQDRRRRRPIGSFRGLRARAARELAPALPWKWRGRRGAER